MVTETNHMAEADLLVASFVPRKLRETIITQMAAPAGSADDYAALLWIDICGFTALSNSLLALGPKGVEMVSHILHEHYEPILNTIDAFGGQPLLFAGDAVLSGWSGKRSDIKALVCNAAACAQAILALKKFPVERQEALSLHVVVASGKCSLLSFGDSTDWMLYTLFGEALTDLGRTVKERAPDKVLLSKNTITALDGALRLQHLNTDVAMLTEAVTLAPVPLETLPPPTAEALKQFRLFVPKPIAYRLEANHLEWINELHRVTIVFSMVPGFASSETGALDGLKRLVEGAVDLVDKHQGVCNQVWLDEKGANFLVFFGPPPAAHIDNPVRALHTARELHELILQAGFDNTVGVATGHAFCGMLGNNLLRQYTILGDVVNLAARLASSGLAGVLCDQETMQSSRRELLFKDPQMLWLKGKSEPVSAWEPAGTSAKEEKKLTQIKTVGRHKELSRLADGLKMVISGQKVAFLITGKSGIGKTKLLADFEQHLVTRKVLAMKMSGDRIARKTPYQAWRRFFASLPGLGTATDYQRRQQAILEFVGEENKEKVCLLNVVLDHDFPDSQLIRNYSAHQRAAATHELLVALVDKMASAQPVVILLDDAHWMDELSWRLATDVYASVRQCLLVCAADVQGKASGHTEFLNAGATVLELDGLSGDSQKELLALALGVNGIEEEVLALISSLTKGNPLFCLELVRTLLMEGIIDIKEDWCRLVKTADNGETFLPQTIQEAVRSRLGNLPAGAGLALKVASVVGEKFPTEGVRRAFPVKPQMNRVGFYLDEGWHADFIYPEVVKEGDGFSFSNAIIREVAYETMLFEQRQKLHLSIADWYEETFRDNLGPVYSRIAHHLEYAGEREKAATYLENEAIRLFRLGFANQSVDTGLKGVELLGLRLERDPAAIGQKIGENLGAIQQLMGSRAIADLLYLEQMTNPKIERMLWMMLRIGPFAFQSQQLELFTLLSVTCLRLTLEYGNSKAAADVYSMYSVIHRELTGDRVAGSAWSQLALDVDSQHGGALFCRVAFVHTWFHNHWRQPLATSLPLALSAATAGFASGEILFAFFNLSAWVVYLAATGASLPTVVAGAEAHLEVNKGEVTNAAFHLVLERQLAKALSGNTENRLSLTDDRYNEERDLAFICHTEFGNQIGYYLVARLKLAVHFGDWRSGLAFAEKTNAVLPAIKGQIAEIELVQFSGLAALLGLANGDGDEVAGLQQAAQTALQTMAAWALLCPENFLAKSLLLHALQEGLQGSFAVAEDLFEKAAAAAGRFSYPNDLCLIYEYQTLVQHYRQQELKSFSLVISSYEQWGALAKVNFFTGKIPGINLQPNACIAEGQGVGPAGWINDLYT